MPTPRAHAAGASAFAVALLATFVALQPLASARDAELVVAVWYRGDATGRPREADLAVIRALGFNGIVSPARGGDEQTKTLQRMADAAGLRLTVAEKPSPLTGRLALAPGERADIAVRGQAPGAISTLAWRAVAHGARTVAFDSGEAQGAGLEHADRSLAAWAKEAVGLARQLIGNARVIEILKPGPGLVVTPAQSPQLNVVLLDAGRSWVLVATNTSAEPLTASVRLPAGVPYALWLSWLDGTTLAMVGEPAGPRWTLRLNPHAARVYVIDKGAGPVAAGDEEGDGPVFHRFRPSGDRP